MFLYWLTSDKPQNVLYQYKLYNIQNSVMLYTKFKLCQLKPTLIVFRCFQIRGK